MDNLLVILKIFQGFGNTYEFISNNLSGSYYIGKGRDYSFRREILMVYK